MQTGDYDDGLATGLYLSSNYSLILMPKAYGEVCVYMGSFDANIGRNHDDPWLTYQVDE